MAQPPRNYANQGYKVTTRTISWQQQVREAEGARWDYPQASYFIDTPAGRLVFVKYNWAVTGPEGL